MKNKDFAQGWYDTWFSDDNLDKQAIDHNHDLCGRHYYIFGKNRQVIQGFDDPVLNKMILMETIRKSRARKIMKDYSTTFICHRTYIFWILKYLLEKCDDISGSELVDKSFEYEQHKGTGFAGNDITRKVICFLFACEVLKPLYYAPTISQQALSSLQYLKKEYYTDIKKFPDVEFVEHFKFEISRNNIIQVLNILKWH